MRDEFAIDLTYHGPMNLTRGRGAERKTCPKLDQLWPIAASRCLGRLIPQGRRPRDTFNASAAFLSPASTRWIGSTAVRRLMPAAELERRLRCVRRRRWAPRKLRMLSFAPHPSTHRPAQWIVPVASDPVHEISIAELLARGSAQPPDRSKQPHHDGGAWAAGLMDTLLGILRRAALIDESRPDRGHVAIDPTREFGARVGRRVVAPGSTSSASARS